MLLIHLKKESEQINLNIPDNIKFKPEVGNFYLFPNYMMHTVYPFSNSKEERRSISFNARIDDEIYNVYGNEKRPKK